VLGLPLAREADFPEAPLMEARLSPRFLREARVLPLAEAPEGLAVALADPLDEAALAALRFATGRPLLLHVDYPAELEAALERLYGDGRSEIDRIVEAAGGRVGEAAGEGADEAAGEAVERLKDLASEAPVIRLVASWPSS